MNKLHFTLLFFLLVLCSCAEKKKGEEKKAEAKIDTIATPKEDKEEEDEFYYIDDNNIIHISAKCRWVRGWDSYRAIGIKPVYKEDFEMRDEYYLCGTCIVREGKSNLFVKRNNDTGKDKTMPGVKPKNDNEIIIINNKWDIDSGE